MRFLVGFDDTGIVGAEKETGKLARRFAAASFGECRCCGVTSRWLLPHSFVPFSLHSGVARLLVEASPPVLKEFVDGNIPRPLRGGRAQGHLYPQGPIASRDASAEIMTEGVIR